jgi:hypothetical protein
MPVETEIRFVIDKADGKTWTQAYVIEHKNIHHALYEAAVWVAERKRDDQ